jgi:chromosome partitioning protein
MTKIIAITNRRGKVGKSTTAVNLSIAFALSGRKTLLADLDSAGSSAKAFGFSQKEITKKIFNTSNSQLFFKRSILKTSIKNLDLIHIKSLPYLDAIKSGELGANVHILETTLKPATTNYDYVIIDCPPHHTDTITASLIAADSVLIPVAPGKFSTAAVRNIIKQIEEIRENYNSELNIDGILMTNYEFNNQSSFTLKKELFKEFPKLIFNTSIPKSTNVTRALEENIPLLSYKPDDRAAKAYIKAADELFERKSLFNTKRKN